MRRKVLVDVAVALVAIVLGLLTASIFILTAGKNPITAYASLFSSAFGCTSMRQCNLFTTLQLATPLILTSMSAVVAFRSGLFSVGQEGQLLLGGMMAAWLGYVIHLPPVLHVFVCCLGAMIVGGIYGYIPGVLKVRLGVNELIVSIVLNSIAALFVRYLINFPLRASASTTGQSPLIDTTARLGVWARGTKLGPGLLIALVAALLVYIYLWRTTAGYAQRMSGQAPRFARYGGIHTDRAAIWGMFLSGALAGLGGAVQVLGVNYRMLDGFSSGLGFDGLTAAILGQVHPFGAVLASIFFAGLRQGAQVGLQFSVRIPRELGGGIIALIILFVAAGELYRSRIDLTLRWWQRRRSPVVEGSAT